MTSLDLALIGNGTIGAFVDPNADLVMGGNPKLIKTVWGGGYMLAAEVKRL